MRGIDILETLLIILYAEIDINEIYMGNNINQMIKYYYAFQNTKD